MKKKLIALSLVLAMLSACASAPSDTAVPTSAPIPTPTATPTPAATPVLTPSPQPSEEPTPVPTMVSYEPVSVDSWLANANCRMPDCSISAPADGKPRLDKMVAWPEEGVTLCYTCQTLEEAAEAFDTTVDELKALNPDWEENFARDGYFYQLKVQAEPYILPQNDVVWVKVRAPWAEYGYKTVYEVPASLDRQAAAAMGMAYYFQQNFCGGLHAGSLPYESAEGVDPRFSVRAVDGALYTKFSEFDNFLHAVYSDKRVKEIAYSEDGFYKEGPDDTILSIDGDRGGNIAYCGYLFTEPEMQPDGSLKFWQIVLTCEDENFHGWDVTEPVTPDTATLRPVHLVPTEGGWRVDQLELSN